MSEDRETYKPSEYATPPGEIERTLGMFQQGYQAGLKAGAQHTYHHYDEQPPKIKVKLERGQKGTYAWEITCEGEYPEGVRAALAEMDTELRATYAPKTGEK